MAQTGQSEEIHSPDECASTVVRLTMPAPWSMAVVCTVAISCSPRVLRTISSPLDSGAYRKVCSAPEAPPWRIVATSDFSGLTRMIWALAKAAARLAIELLDWCTAITLLIDEEIETDGSRLGTLGPDAMAGGFLGVLGHQALQFGLGLFVLLMRRSGPGKDCGKLCP